MWSLGEVSGVELCSPSELVEHGRMESLHACWNVQEGQSRLLSWFFAI